MAEQKKNASIMMQGTMSNAGKSILTAALCRILVEDGYHPAPFKSQNMALNSYITKDGKEMGRAQVMQAEAAKIEPTVQMNPILLKPTNDVGSQVIVNGKVLGNMKAKDYFVFKKQLIPDILEAYESLLEKHDVIVIEGAGSPAEINLKENDIVNMGLAEMVDAPVLLVGDIDRGGVFAQLLGTIMLLSESEKARVKGLIINKFRGDKTILDPGIKMLEEKAGIPVVGVIPYMDVSIEDEDSLSSSLEKKDGTGIVDIAVIRFPRISNFTDFFVLEQMEGVGLRYVDKVEQLGTPDMIILPGTKNTIGDLKWFRGSGIEAAVFKAAARESVIFGICGGFQMLGEKIIDINGVESLEEIAGMKLLPFETAFQEEKTTLQKEVCLGQIKGPFASLSGLPVKGYEIHMGESVLTDGSKVGILEHREMVFDSVWTEKREQKEEQDRVQKRERLQESTTSCHVYGTYLHGFFDAPNVARLCMEGLAKKKGVVYEPGMTIDYEAYKQSQYDMLAKIVREHMDMERIYQIIFG